MTVTVVDPVNLPARLTGNGVATVFNFQFKIRAKNDLNVWVAGNLKTVDLDYTVAGFNNNAGGTVTFFTAPDNGAAIVIVRDIDIARQTDYQQQGDFLSSTVNPDFDGAVLMLQDLLSKFRRCLRFAEQDVNSSAEMTALGNFKSRYLFINALGELEPAAAIAMTTLTQSLIASLLFPLSTAEGLAGAVVVNSTYPIGSPDRYATNVSPGNTDMTAAFSMAFAVAKQFGCEVTWGYTGPYRLNSPVNCTGLRGTTIRDISSRNVGAGQAAIIVAHTGHGFDLSTSNETAWHDVTITSLAATTPKTGWFMARNAAASSSELHKFYRCRSPSNCTFTQVVYGYGSEEMTFVDCFFYNGAPGSTVINLNATNPSGYSSSFLTIATGSQSNTVFNLFGTSILNAGNSGGANESCIQLEGAGDFTMKGGLLACLNGAAYINVVGAGISSNKLVMVAVRGEPAGTKPPRGISVVSTGTTGVNAHVNWQILNCSFTLSGSGVAVYLDDNAEVNGLQIAGCSADTGNLLRAKFLTHGRIDHRAQVCTFAAAGTIQNSYFFGTKSAITFSGTDSLNGGWDTANARSWQSAESFTSASTACTGAITAAVQWSLTLNKRLVSVTIPSINAVATAAASFTVGATVPAQYRPPADERIPILIRDNGASPNQIGFLIINAATGVMSIFKDPLGTGNFTAAAGAGIPTQLRVRWEI